jgi:hypothetical protein
VPDSTADDREVFARRGPSRPIVLGAVAIGVLLAIAPVLGSPYTSDDVINRTMPDVLRINHETRWHFIIATTSAWMENIHRFFPGAITFSTFLFSTFTTRASYKVFLFVLLAAVALLFGLWLVRSIGVPMTTIAVAALAACWQFRYSVTFDGLTCFGGLLPWSIALMVGTMALLAKRPHRWHVAGMVLAICLWALAVTTYEYTVILAPAVLASLWLFDADRRWRIGSGAVIVIGALGELVISESLHSRLKGVRPADYVLNFRLGPWAATTAKQLLGSIPMSQYWIPGPEHPSLRVTIPVVLATVVLSVVLVTALIAAWRGAPILERRRVLLLAGVGSWFWLAPALLAGATLRWQLTEPWGQAYIPVVFESLGVALVLVAGVAALKRQTVKGGGGASISSAAAMTLLMATGVAVALTAAANYLMVFAS